MVMLDLFFVGFSYIFLHICLSFPLAMCSLGEGTTGMEDERTQLFIGFVALIGFVGFFFVMFQPTYNRAMDYMTYFIIAEVVALVVLPMIYAILSGIAFLIKKIYQGIVYLRRKL